MLLVTELVDERGRLCEQKSRSQHCPMSKEELRSWILLKDWELSRWTISESVFRGIGVEKRS